MLKRALIGSVLANDMPKRILFIINSSVDGGAQRNVLYLAKALSMDYDVAIACPTGKLFEKSSASGLKTFRIPTGSLAVFSIRRLAERFKPDIIHAHLLGAAFFTALARCGNARLIVTLHNKPIYPGASFLRRILYPLALAFICRHTETMICASSEIAGDLSKIFPTVNTRVIRNFLPLEEWPRKSLDVNPRTIRIGVLGALVKAKGHCYLFEALSLLASEIGLEVFIAGDGVLAKPLTSMVKRLHLTDTVQFLGHIEDIQSFLDSVDIVVVPSIFEGMPYSIIEAMAAGKPVIATTVGDIPDMVVHGVTGILVPPKDPKALASAIKVISNDLGKIALYGRAARSRIEVSFSQTAIIPEYIKCYT